MSVLGIAVGVIGLSVVVFLFGQLRARRIRERYVWLWLILLVGLGALGLVPGLLSRIATLLGFQLVSNLVLAAASLVTFLITVGLSTEVSKLQLSVRTLAEEVAFLRADREADREAATELEPGSVEPTADTKREAG